MKLKKGDKVIVIAGNAKGSSGIIEKVLPKDGKITIGGVKVREIHHKAKGLIKRSSLVDASNVMFVDPKENKPTRLGYRFVDGKKVRFAKLSDTDID